VAAKKGNGCLGVILFAVIVFYFVGGSHSNSNDVSTPATPPIDVAKLLAKGEIGCRDNIAIWGSNHHTQSGAIGFFIQFNKGRAKLYALDQPKEDEGSEKISGKVHKSTEGSETFYTFQQGSGYVQFQVDGANVANVIWKPDQYAQKEYMITPSTVSGCAVKVG